MDWNGFWNSVKNFFSDNVWNIALFFAVLVFGFAAVRLIANADDCLKAVEYWKKAERKK